MINYLYRYYNGDADYQFDSILRQTLYFSHVDCFNDSNEFEFHYEVPPIFSTTEIMSTPEFLDISKKYGEDVAVSCEIRDETTRQSSQSLSIDMFKFKNRVCCFTTSFKNVDMWKHKDYANTTGFCVEYPYESILNIGATISHIRYSNDKPKIRSVDLESGRLDPTFMYRKEFAWCPEQEIRAVLQIPESDVVCVPNSVKDEWCRAKQKAFCCFNRRFFKKESCPYKAECEEKGIGCKDDENIYFDDYNCIYYAPLRIIKHSAINCIYVSQYTTGDVLKRINNIASKKGIEIKQVNWGG